LLNAGYFVPIVYAAFFKEPNPDDHAEHGEAPLPVVATVVATAIGTIVLFFFPGTLLELSYLMAGGRR
jgi:multicomponent Na+:H+ antiporter subunit D